MFSPAKAAKPAAAAAVETKIRREETEGKLEFDSIEKAGDHKPWTLRSIQMPDDGKAFATKFGEHMYRAALKGQSGNTLHSIWKECRAVINTAFDRQKGNVIQRKLVEELAGICIDHFCVSMAKQGQPNWSGLLGLAKVRATYVDLFCDLFIAAADESVAAEVAEAKANSIDFTGTMYASVELKIELGALAKIIDPADLCADEAVTKGKPIAKDHHLTVKLGLDPNTDEGDLRKALVGIAPFKLSVGGGLGHFHNSGTFASDGKVHERDILFAKIDDSEANGLQTIRKALGPFELSKDKSDTGRPYHPHVTLAFLEYGMGQYYEKNENLIKAVAGTASVATVKSLTFKVIGPKDKVPKPFTIDLVG